MITYFRSLNEREQWMVGIGSFCLFFYLYYMLLYAPLHHRVEQKSQQLIEKSKDLSWMQSLQGEHHALQKKELLTNSQLLSQLSNQLKSNTALNFPYQLKQTSSGDIQLNFDTVPFDVLINWLSDINSTYQFTLKELDAKQTDTPGLTQLSLVISANSSP